MPRIFVEDNGLFAESLGWLAEGDETEVKLSDALCVKMIVATES